MGVENDIFWSEIRSGFEALQLHADLSVYPKFWGYQVFIYSGYCSCHCRLPSEESTSGIPLI